MSYRRHKEDQLRLKKLSKNYHRWYNSANYDDERGCYKKFVMWGPELKKFYKRYSQVKVRRMQIISEDTCDRRKNVLLKGNEYKKVFILINELV